MPVTFNFVEGTTIDQARPLLHKIGELPAVETFGEMESAPSREGALLHYVVFERLGDDADEDIRARADIARALALHAIVGDVCIQEEP